MGAVDAQFADWLDSLSEDQRTEVLAAVGGELPAWTVDSLVEAGLIVVHAELTHGDPAHHGYLMPTRFTEFLERYRSTVAGG